MWYRKPSNVVYQNLSHEIYILKKFSHQKTFSQVYFEIKVDGVQKFKEENLGPGEGLLEAAVVAGTFDIKDVGMNYKILELRNMNI